MRLEATYANEELFYVVRTLGIEEDVDGLKYAKIVIATDADVDGLHIRNLLLTFFLQYFMQLVLSGHLYIFETPLFRVRNTKTTFYCYSEQERDEKAKELGGNVEITRFKGLGEISPDEFKQFVGPDSSSVPTSTSDRSLLKIPRTFTEFFADAWAGTTKTVGNTFRTT